MQPVIHLPTPLPSKRCPAHLPWDPSSLNTQVISTWSLHSCYVISSYASLPVDALFTLLGFLCQVILLHNCLITLPGLWPCSGIQWLSLLSAVCLCSAQSNGFRANVFKKGKEEVLVVILISLMTSHGEHIFMFIVHSHISFYRYLFKYLMHFILDYSICWFIDAIKIFAVDIQFLQTHVLLFFPSVASVYVLSDVSLCIIFQCIIFLS